MRKRSTKSVEKKERKAEKSNNDVSMEKKSQERRRKNKAGCSKESSSSSSSSKMTLCTQPTLDRPQRRPGRPPTGKRFMPGKLRSAYRRSLDPCDNSNDSGLGFDPHSDPLHHTSSMTERLSGAGERTEAKRLRLNIKVENEEANDSYCFPNPSVLQCKDNISLIRTTPVGSVPPLSILNNTSTSTNRSIARCPPNVNRQAPTAPVALTTQLSSSSRYSDVSLTIIKQPEQQHRARYQTEGSRGAVKDREGNGFPVVQLIGYHKPAVLQVYIGTDVGKVAPHMFYQACKVSGKNSTPCMEKKVDGTCVIELTLDPAKDMCATCDCVGILKERNVDVEHRFPDQLGNRSKKKSTRCRMVFRTTITHDDGTTETLQVGSQPIVCTQPPGIPEICKKSLTSCPASGGLELFVLGKNFLKDTKVYFQQYEDGNLCWEQAVVPDKEYLQQTHFVCVVPPYRRANITEPVPVRLCVVSSGKTSETHQFVYTPVNGTVSVYTDAHAQHAPTFKGALWNCSSTAAAASSSSSSSSSNVSPPLTFRKHQQDLDMMPPPDSNLVPLSTRRPSVSLPSSQDAHSPPMVALKQEYIDENSQNSMSDSMDMHVGGERRFRPLSESSLDVNHDSNMSMMNDNSMDVSMMGGGHVDDNSNMSDESVEMVRRNSMSAMHEEESRSGGARTPIAIEKVIDLRMKNPMNAAPMTDYVTTASSLRKFGIEHTSAPLMPQSAQSVENYLTKIEAKPLGHSSNALLSTMKGKESIMVDAMSNMLVSAPQTSHQPQLLTTHQPFLTESNAIATIVKSEAAAIAEQVMTGTTTISNANTTLTTSLEGSISTPINAEKLDEILHSTLESHMGSPSKPINAGPSTGGNSMLTNQDVMLVSSASMNGSLTSPLLVQEPQQHAATTLSPEAILNSQLSPSLMCRTASTLQHDSLIGAAALSAICQGTTAATDTTGLLPSTLVASQSVLLPAVAQESAGLLNSEPEKAVLLEAAVDFLKTQKKISELTTSSPDIMGIASTATNTTSLAMDGGYLPFTTGPSTSTDQSLLMPKTLSDPKRDFIPMPIVKDTVATDMQNDRKNDDRMIPSSFTSLTENELINLINPTCFDQGNNYPH